MIIILLKAHRKIIISMRAKQYGVLGAYGGGYGSGDAAGMGLDEDYFTEQRGYAEGKKRIARHS